MSKKGRDKAKYQKTQNVKDINPWFERNSGKLFILILFLLPLIYFAPFLSPNRMIAGSDYLLGGYPVDKWMAEEGGISLWQPYVFGGMPILGAPSGNPLAPFHQLKKIIPPQVAIAIQFILFTFLGGLGVYLYIKDILSNNVGTGFTPVRKSSQAVAFISGIAYMCIGNVLSTPYGGHLGRTISITLFPLALFFLHRGLVQKRIFYYIFAGGVSALAFYEGHFQMTYYAILFAIAYILFFLVYKRRENGAKGSMKIILFCILTAVVVLCLTSAIWLPTLSGLGTVARGQERGYEYASSWAMPPLELLDLIVPTFSGILGNYWGLNYFKLHIEYLGIIPIVLFIIGIFLCIKSSVVKFFIATLLVAILIALGSYTPFFKIPYYLVPGFKLFRGPSMIFFLASFSVIVVGAFGLQQVIERGNNLQDRGRKPSFATRYIIIALIILGIYLLVGGILSSSKGILTGWMRNRFYPEVVSQYGPHIASQKLTNFDRNYSGLISGIWRTFLLLSISLSLFFAMLKKVIKLPLFIAAVFITMLIDTLTIERKFLPYGPSPEDYYKEDAVANFLERDKSIYRVFPYRYEHAKDCYLMYHNIQSLGGYVANPIQRYQELIGAGTSVMFDPKNLYSHAQLLHLLNTKYVITYTLPDDISRYDESTKGYINAMKEYLSQFREVIKGRKYSVYLNEHCLDRAFIVRNYRVFHNQDSLLAFMLTPSFNPREVVLLEEPITDYRLPITDYKDTERVSITKYTPDRIVCEVNLSAPGFLVLSDNYHPDWKVFVDGKEDKLYIADYTLRAVYLPKGEHKVEFIYKSHAFQTGSVISLLSFLFLLGTIGVWVKREKRRE